MDGNQGREVVILAAAKVGGILANNRQPAEFLQQNLLIQTHLIGAPHRTGVEKLLFLGSSCIYPKLAAQPIDENSLLTGSLEPTNQWYAIAKIAGVKPCQAYRRQYGADFISAMPTNLCGPGDNFDPETSRALPALMRKMHESQRDRADRVEIWGSGRPRREILHVDDLADACIHLLKTYSNDLAINVGFGPDVAIGQLASMIAELVAFKGELKYDLSKPDGMPRKLLNCARILNLGWRPPIDLEGGLQSTYQWYRDVCRDGSSRH